jgi:hypothetical protein
VTDRQEGGRCHSQLEMRAIHIADGVHDLFRPNPCVFRSSMVGTIIAAALVKQRANPLAQSHRGKREGVIPGFGFSRNEMRRKALSRLKTRPKMK